VTASAGASSSLPSPDTVRRYSLSGPSVPLDPDHDAFRRDVADIALAGRVVASHFAEPVIRRATADADVRRGREADAEVACRLTAGEEFAVLDFSGGVAWGYCVQGHRVGYVPAHMLG